MQGESGHSEGETQSELGAYVGSRAGVLQCKCFNAGMDLIAHQPDLLQHLCLLYASSARHFSGDALTPLILGTEKSSNSPRTVFLQQMVGTDAQNLSNSAVKGGNTNTQTPPL